MKHYAGLDVSVKETSICIVDEAAAASRTINAGLILPLPRLVPLLIAQTTVVFLRRAGGNPSCLDSGARG